MALDAATRLFQQHAQTDAHSGERYMTEEGFVNAIAPTDEDYHKIPREYYGLLFNAADRRRISKINLQDWIAFESLLSKPDAEYEIAFRVFDVAGTGKINYDTLQKLCCSGKGDGNFLFDWNSTWASLYVGGKESRHELDYRQFTQMLRGLQGERIRQAFHQLDKDDDGFIEPEDFQRIILETSRHKLSDHLLENLPSLCHVTDEAKISYATVRAFQNIMQEMDLVDQVVRSAVKKSKDGHITRSDFLTEASSVAQFTRFTPLEADILFHFAGLDTPSRKLSLGDFTKVIDASWSTASSAGKSAISSAKHKVEGGAKSFLHGVLESVHHFGLGSIAGAFGAFMVYPIDLVKTRMQNQRSGVAGQQLYENSIDCAKKVVRNEGVFGLYSGVLPQLIGVAPEKAIKLTVNDLARERFTDKTTGQIWWPWEAVAGGTAGGCQVLITNPLEIVKIRLQVQGEISKHSGAPRRSAIWIIKNLGLKGLYKGASACLLRDMPFSAIYFPGYAHLKSDFFGESETHKLSVLQLLTAGAIAGMPAAYFTTPSDVIKTRLQVEARKGETKYHDVGHAAATIWKEEGIKAFFKGGPARILRSSPQFGFTLASYEVLQKLLPLPGSQTDGPAPGWEPPATPLSFLRSRNAVKLMLDLDTNFGRPQLPPAGFPFPKQ